MRAVLTFLLILAAVCPPCAVRADGTKQNAVPRIADAEAFQNAWRANDPDRDIVVPEETIKKAEKDSMEMRIVWQRDYNVKQVEPTPKNRFPRAVCSELVRRHYFKNDLPLHCSRDYLLENYCYWLMRISFGDPVGEYRRFLEIFILAEPRFIVNSNWFKNDGANRFLGLCKNAKPEKIPELWHMLLEFCEKIDARAAAGKDAGLRDMTFNIVQSRLRELMQFETWSERLDSDALLAVWEKHSALLLKYIPGNLYLLRLRSMLEKGEREKAADLLSTLKLPKGVRFTNAGYSPEDLLRSLNYSNTPAASVNEIPVEWDARGAEIRDKIAEAAAPDRIASVIRNELPERANRFLPTEDPDLFVSAIPDVRKSLTEWKDVYHANLREFLAVLRWKLALDKTGVEIRFNRMSLDEAPANRSAAPARTAAVLPDDAAFAAPRRVFELESAFFPDHLEMRPDQSRIRRVPAFVLRHGEYTFAVNANETICLRDGKVLWRTLDDNLLSGLPRYQDNECRAAVCDGVFATFCRIEENNPNATGIRACDLNTGKVLWTWWIPNGFATDIQAWNGRFVLLAAGAELADKGCIPAGEQRQPCAAILLDPATGREEGRRYLFPVADPLRGWGGSMSESLRPPMPRMTLDGSIAYIDSGIGRIAAFDLVKQEIRWQRLYGLDLTLYVQPFRSAYSARRMPSALSGGSPIAGRDVLIAAPPLSRFLFRIDKKTGRLLARRMRQPGQIRGGADAGKTLFLTTAFDVISYDAETLEQIGSLPLEKLNANPGNRPENFWCLPEFCDGDSFALYADGKISLYDRKFALRRAIPVPEGFLPLYGGSDHAFYLFRETAFDRGVYAVGKNAPPADPASADTARARVELPPPDAPVETTLTEDERGPFNNGIIRRRSSFYYNRSIGNFIPRRRNGHRDASDQIYEQNRNMLVRYNADGKQICFPVQNQNNFLYDPGAKTGFSIRFVNGGETGNVDIYSLETGQLKGVWPGFDSRRNPGNGKPKRKFWNICLADGDKLYFLSARNEPSSPDNRLEICSLDADGAFCVEHEFLIPEDPALFRGVGAIGRGGRSVLLWSEARSRQDGRKYCAVGHMRDGAAGGPETLRLTGETTWDKNAVSAISPILFFKDMPLLNDGRFVLAIVRSNGKKNTLLLADLEKGKFSLPSQPAFPIPKEDVTSPEFTDPRAFAENGIVFLSFNIRTRNGQLRFWSAYDPETGGQIPGFYSLAEPLSRGSRIYGLMPEIEYSQPDPKQRNSNANRTGAIKALRLVVYDTAAKQLLPERRLPFAGNGIRFQNYQNPWNHLALAGFQRNGKIYFLAPCTSLGIAMAWLFESGADENFTAVELPAFQMPMRPDNFAITDNAIILPHNPGRYQYNGYDIRTPRVLPLDELLRLKEKKAAVLPPVPVHFHEPFRLDGFADEWDERDWIALGKNRWQARLDGNKYLLAVQVRDPELVSALLKNPAEWQKLKLAMGNTADMRIGGIGIPSPSNGKLSADPVTNTLTFEAEFIIRQSTNSGNERVRGTFFFNLLPVNGLPVDVLTGSPFGTAFFPTGYFEPEQKKAPSGK